VDHFFDFGIDGWLAGMRKAGDLLFCLLRYTFYLAIIAHAKQDNPSSGIGEGTDCVTHLGGKTSLEFHGLTFATPYNFQDFLSFHQPSISLLLHSPEISTLPPQGDRHFGKPACLPLGQLAPWAGKPLRGQAGQGPGCQAPVTDLIKP